MSTDHSLTLRLTPEIEDKLNQLAARTSRSRVGLATAAIESFLAHEGAHVTGILSGLDDMRTGRVIPHDDAMAELDAAIEEVARGRS